MKKEFIIEIDDSIELSHLVQKFLFNKGYAWTDTILRGYTKCCFCYINKYNYLSYSSKEYLLSEANYKNFPIFNAATEFGKFIEFIDKEEIPPRPKNKKISIENVNIEFFADGSLTIGGISFDDLEKITNERRTFLGEVIAWDAKYGK